MAIEALPFSRVRLVWRLGLAASTLNLSYEIHPWAIARGGGAQSKTIQSGSGRLLLPDLVQLRINHARPMISRVIIRPMHFHFPRGSRSRSRSHSRSPKPNRTNLKCPHPHLRQLRVTAENRDIWCLYLYLYQHRYLFLRFDSFWPGSKPHWAINGARA